MPALANRSFLSDPRRIYGFDAGLCVLSGLVFVTFSGPLTGLIGWSLSPTAILVAGIFLFPWALCNFWVARSARVSRLTLLIHMIVDGGWVLLTLALLFVNSAQITAFGITIMVAQALLVSAVFVTKIRTFEGA